MSNYQRRRDSIDYGPNELAHEEEEQHAAAEMEEDDSEVERLADQDKKDADYSLSQDSDYSLSQDSDYPSSQRSIFSWEDEDIDDQMDEDAKTEVADGDLTNDFGDDQEFDAFSDANDIVFLRRIVNARYWCFFAEGMDPTGRLLRAISALTGEDLEVVKQAYDRIKKFSPRAGPLTPADDARIVQFLGLGAA